MTDPIADMLTRIRNSALRSHQNVSIPHSRLKEGVVKVLLSEGFISSYKVEKEKFKSLIVSLKYDTKNECVVRKIVRVSKPGLRIHKSYLDLKPLMNGQGIFIVSTSNGIMPDSECRKLKIGGEVLCSVY